MLARLRRFFAGAWRSPVAVKGKRQRCAGATWTLQPVKIVGRGDPETGTKNWTVRRVPMIPDARTLFGQMHSERNAESPNEKVFRVNEAQKEQLTARHANSVFRASPTMTFGICLPPSESKPESRSQPSPAGSGIKTAARSP